MGAGGIVPFSVLYFGENNIAVIIKFVLLSESGILQAVLNVLFGFVGTSGVNTNSCQTQMRARTRRSFKNRVFKVIKQDLGIHHFCVLIGVKHIAAVCKTKDAVGQKLLIVRDRGIKQGVERGGEHINMGV